MTWIAILALAAGLSVDAFAAAMAKGARLRRISLRAAVGIGLMFGAMEAIAPVIGWGVGRVLADQVREYDHWLAFALLAGVGGHMMIRAVREMRAPPAARAGAEPTERRGLGGMALTALATSIDAAAVGVSLAFVDVNIWIAALTIAAVTSALATVGVLLGKTAGERLGARAELLGGVVLVAIGAMILFEHLSGGAG